MIFIKILLLAALLLVSVGGTVWWIARSDWYDRGMMDE